MPLPLDSAVATRIARTVREENTSQNGSAAGQAFERSLFHGLESIFPWDHCASPDQFDMALDLVGKSGTHYEFDGVFLGNQTLYVIEAKKVGSLTRQHVGVFIYKLLDVLLGTRDYLGPVDVKPILACAGSKISAAAWSHAISWGVLLVAPDRPTPAELLTILPSGSDSVEIQALQSDCEILAHQLWRPINRLVYPSTPDSLIYFVDTNRIYDKSACQRLIELWQQCIDRVPAGIHARH